MNKTFYGLVTALGLALASPALAEGDTAKGEKVFKKCKACHAVGEGAKNKVGPQLNGIAGKAAGKDGSFKYSKGMLAAADEGLTWDDETLAAYLTKPKEVVPKTKMSFAGLRKEDDVANVIAYLKTFQ